MDIWEPRRQSERILHAELATERELVEQLFATTDLILQEFDQQRESIVARVAGLALLKAKRLALAIYSLIIDCIGQEAGALFRPLLETWEFLIYLRQDPSRAQEVIEDRVPKAGEIAKRIGAKFKSLRDHLNQHAAHLAFSFESMTHLMDYTSFKFQLTNRPSVGVLRQNMGVLFSVLLLQH